MGKAFMRGQVEKSYLAVVQPAPVMGQGEVHLPLLKIQARMCPHPEGQVAHTTWRVLRRWGDKALVQLIPLTGRMHQLRAHMAAIGCPIMGDVFYQGAPAPRLMLHAYKLKLPLKPAIIAGLSWVKTQ